MTKVIRVVTKTPYFVLGFLLTVFQIHIAFCSSDMRSNKIIDKIEDQSETTVEHSTSRNPKKGVTTDTIVQRTHSKLKNKYSTVKAEEIIKTKKQTTDDGKKTIINTQETYVEQEEEPEMKITP